MDKQIVELLEPIADRPGASEEALEHLRQYVGADLPTEYLGFLRWSNGAEGFMRSTGWLGKKLGGEGHYLALYRAEKIPELTDLGSDMPPGYLAIGNSGDSTFYVLLDTRSRNPETMEFVQFDPYGEGAGVEYRTTSFYELLDHLSTVFAHLPGTDLRSAPLQGAHLYHADLAGADLSGADLAGADLRNADLTGVNLSQTNLTGTKLAGAYYDQSTRWPEGFDAQQHGAEFVK
jgi:hypothetical protein